MNGKLIVIDECGSVCGEINLADYPHLRDGSNDGEDAYFADLENLAIDIETALLCGESV